METGWLAPATANKANNVLERFLCEHNQRLSPFDHSTMLYGSGISERNSHSKINLPTVVTARANGRFQGGHHIGYPKGTPMANLFMTMLDYMDVHPESIGDSNGKLEHLADLL